MSFDDILEATASGQSGLPASCFFDRQFLELERERFFAPQWICIGLSLDIPQSGEWFPVDVVGQPLLMTRDSKSLVHVFHNVCSHRGALLLEKPSKGQTIACPYHCWTYDSEGRLLRTPHLGGAGRHKDPGFDRTLHGLVELESAEFAGLIFACLGRATQPFETSVAPLVERWREADLSAYAQAPGMTLRPSLHANWKIAIENFVESYHLPWVHPELDRVNPMRDHYQILGGRHFVGQGSTSHTGSSGPDPLPLVAGGPDRSYGEAVYMPPNLMLTRFPDFMMVNIVMPLAPDLTGERIELFVHPEAASGSRHQRGREALMDFLRGVNDEDIAICEKVQRGRRSPAFRGGFFARQHEATSQQFQRMLAMQILGRDAAAALLPSRDIPYTASLSA